MNTPAPGTAPEETTSNDTMKLRVARGLLFGIGGFDGNASLAVLADSLDEVFAKSRSANKSHESGGK